MKKVYAGLAIGMTLIMLIAAGISYQQVTATYQNFRLTHRRYRHPSGHLHLSRTLTIND
ncbi:MAG: hypothetical protein ACTIAG_01795 [Lactobacillus sp.]|nr:hypothetical protein [Lactobacillus sp.]MDN6052828.1 hypothetical protein [Lactobacillus sp.]